MSSRLDELRSVRHLVVKLGTQLLNDRTNTLDATFVAGVAGQVAALRAGNRRVTIVSSGAVGCGLRLLGLAKRPRDLATLQAVAAVGQRRLMDAWAEAFEPLQIPVAQVLLTRDDIDDRTRFLNLRNTIGAIHRLGAVPIINENDTVSTDELVRITFGDNDLLAALVCQALRADLLVLMTVVDGVLDAAGKPLRTVAKLEEAERLVRNETSQLGKGGMNSKLGAARLVTGAGEAMIVADGRTPDLLPRLLAGEELGTFFAPRPQRAGGRGRWIRSARPAGTVYVDDGAAAAVVEKNRSLLPAGVSRVEGRFERGDVVAIAAADGRALAHGLSNYASGDVDRLKGKRSAEVRQLLGPSAYEEVVHRDNLVLLP
jgi:glutamate 5-kinase